MADVQHVTAACLLLLHLHMRSRRVQRFSRRLLDHVHEQELLPLVTNGYTRNFERRRRRSTMRFMFMLFGFLNNALTPVNRAYMIMIGVARCSAIPSVSVVGLVNTDQK